MGAGRAGGAEAAFDPYQGYDTGDQQRDQHDADPDYVMGIDGGQHRILSNDQQNVFITRRDSVVNAHGGI